MTDFMESLKEREQSLRVTIEQLQSCLVKVRELMALEMKVRGVEVESEKQGTEPQTKVTATRKRTLRIKFHPRACSVCAEQFIPTGARNKVCKGCRSNLKSGNNEDGTKVVTAHAIQNMSPEKMERMFETNRVAIVPFAKTGVEE